MPTLEVTPEVAPAASQPSTIEPPREHEADISEAWFADHLTKHPGSRILSVKDLRFCAIFMETFEDSDTELIETLIYKGWQDEFFPLVSWWATLMRRLAVKKRGPADIHYGYGERYDRLIDTVTPMISAFRDMLACAATGLTTSYDSGEPNYCLLEETIGVYRVWTRKVCEMAWRVMPDRDWSDLEQLV